MAEPESVEYRRRDLSQDAVAGSRGLREPEFHRRLLHVLAETAGKIVAVLETGFQCDIRYGLIR